MCGNRFDEFRQFAVLMVGLICMGAGLGFERSLLPRMAVDIFDETSAITRLLFVASFGGFKAFANVLAGPLADRFGRKPTLALGFLVGLPVMPYVIIARSWTGITVMNVAFGLSQGLLGSALFFLLIDVMGPSQRGVAVGLGECTIYVSTAVVNVWAGALATEHGYRPVPFLWATGFAALGLLSTVPLRDTLDRVKQEQSEHGTGGPFDMGSSSDEDEDDDLSDEAEFLEYGIRPEEGDDGDDLKKKGGRMRGRPSPPTPETVSVTTEETPLLPAQAAAGAGAGAGAGGPRRPPMERIWSGDSDDFESDLERMLRQLKDAPPAVASAAAAAAAREDDDDDDDDDSSPSARSFDRSEEAAPPDDEEQQQQHRRFSDPSALPPGAGFGGGGASASGSLRRVGSDPSRLPPGAGFGGAASAGPPPRRGHHHRHHHHHHRRVDSSGSGDSIPRLLADTPSARYMSVDAYLPPKEPERRPPPAPAGGGDGGVPPSTTKPPQQPPPPPPEMVPDPPLQVMGRLLTNANYVSLCFTGMASNFKDGFAWGTFPVFFSNVHHLSDSRTDLLIALYPLCWGGAQAFTGAASDRFGRQLFLTSGMASCTVAMLLFALPQMIWGRTVEHLGEVDAAGFVWIVADILLGLGTALAYPALQAGAADEVDPINRGLGLGFYRFVRDMGYVVGALVCGKLTDGIGYQATFLVVAAVMAAGTYLMAITYTPRRKTVLIGGGRRIVLRRKESVGAKGVGFAD